ncbi:FecR family protein [Sphingomonas guangdongensis]|uniref:FecR family protein n=1 Tax=Sphingomonas guangdongensis TaxID=1141890 RepID=A0A285QCL1_9SPHN|nr:FecR domain-containing protein [Sphingomonas guangdongensis]SOB79189.1 FecR family protein [Sphingomonas guangdongensis]
MTARPDDLPADEAARWALRVRDPAFADWDGFTAWLEADLANNAAYEAALDEQEAADALFDVTPAQPVATAPERAPRWRLPAIAASVALLAGVGGWLTLDHGAELQTYETKPGERRTVALADGSRIVLNGGTRLSLDPDRPRVVAMANGEALFQVRHDATDPFVVTTADGTRLVDVGTIFNVEVNGGALDVGVSEGAVVYRGVDQAREVRLDAGEMLTRAATDASPVKRPVDRETVGGWQTGYLQYTDAPLPSVATDLTRSLGVPVAVDSALADRRFSGTLSLEGGAETVMPQIAPVLDVQLRRAGDGWTMTSRDARHR